MRRRGSSSASSTTFPTLSSFWRASCASHFVFVSTSTLSLACFLRVASPRHTPGHIIIVMVHEGPPPPPIIIIYLTHWSRYCLLFMLCVVSFRHVSRPPPPPVAAGLPANATQAVVFCLLCVPLPPSLLLLFPPSLLSRRPCLPYGSPTAMGTAGCVRFCRPHGWPAASRTCHSAPWTAARAGPSEVGHDTHHTKQQTCCQNSAMHECSGWRQCPNPDSNKLYRSRR